MRYSENHKEETYAKLVKIAARTFREKAPMASPSPTL